MDWRRFPRCFAKLKAYFPGEEKPYEVTNISYKGCFIKTDKLIPKGRLIYFELELPDIGLIPIYGLVVRHDLKEPGMGIEIVEVDKNLNAVWALYLKALSYIEQAKKIYRENMDHLPEALKTKK